MSTTMSVAHDGHVVIDLPAQVIHVSRDDLEAIVQAAYDEHGILAVPAYAIEADRTPDVLGMIHGHVNAALREQIATRMEAQAARIRPAKVSA